jgi:predicted transcriptional regulator
VVSRALKCDFLGRYVERQRLRYAYIASVRIQKEDLRATIRRVCQGQILALSCVSAKLGTQKMTSSPSHHIYTFFNLKTNRLKKYLEESLYNKLVST